MNLAISTLKDFFLPPLKQIEPDTPLNCILDYIRDRITTTLLRFCALLGIPAVAIGNMALIAHQDYAPLLVGNLALVIIIFLALKPTIPHRIRSGIFLILAYLFLVSSVTDYFDEMTLAVLLAFVVVTALLWGRNGSIVAILVTTLLIGWINWLVTTKQIEFQTALAPFDTVLFLSPYFTWLFYVGVIVFTLWIFFDGFDIAWNLERQTAALLQSERDRLEQALEREQLLMVELENSYQRESELSRLKSEIIITVSHEFRTPLTAINTSADMLMRYGDKLSASKKAQLHERIHHSVFYLNDLLKEVGLVNTANSTGIQITVKESPFPQWCLRLESDLRQECDNPPNVHFHYNTDEKQLVTADYLHLKQVLVCLLTNAIKYSDATQPIEISIQISGHLEISVADQGIGILQQDINHIWGLFYRGSNVSTRRGLGLGLHIAKRITRQMGGTLTAESAGANRGSRFIVKIPQKPL